MLEVGEIRSDCGRVGGVHLRLQIRYPFRDFLGTLTVFVAFILRLRLLSSAALRFDFLFSRGSFLFLGIICRARAVSSPLAEVVEGTPEFVQFELALQSLLSENVGKGLVGFKHEAVRSPFPLLSA